MRPTFILTVAGQKLICGTPAWVYWERNPFPKVLMSSFRERGSWEIETEIGTLALLPPKSVPGSRLTCVQQVCVCVSVVIIESTKGH